MKALASNVLAIRPQRKWSQQRLAEAAGMSRVRSRPIEKGEANITLDSLAALAAVFEIPPHQAGRLLVAGDATDGAPTVPLSQDELPTLGATAPVKQGFVALEFSEKEVFQVARVLASHLGRVVALIDPSTRIVVCLVGPKSYLRLPGCQTLVHQPSRPPGVGDRAPAVRYNPR
jgi:transcriptional regulator with XRE-family HTH domain